MKLHYLAKKCFFCLCLLIAFIGGCSSKSDIKKTTDESAIRSEEVKVEQGKIESAAAPSLEGIKIIDEKDFCRVIVTMSKQPTYTVFKLSKPDRIIIDLQDMLPGLHQELQEVQNDVISTIKSQLIKDMDRTFLRIEVGLKRDIIYSAKNENNAIFLDLPRAQGTAGAEMAQKDTVKAGAFKQETTLRKDGPAHSKQQKFISINDINISQTSLDSKISIITDSEIEKYTSYLLKKPNRLVIDLPRAKVIGKQPLCDAKNPFVEKVRVGEKDNDVRIVVDFKGEKLPPYQIDQVNNILNINLNVQEKADRDTSKEKTAQKPPEDSAKVEGGLVIGAEQSAPAKAETKTYIGEKISFDFKDADIKNVLRLIADISGLNIIVGDRVQGKVTLKLENIAWDEAFDIILENNGLGRIESKNIIRIDTSEQIKKINEDKLQAKKSQEQVEDTKIKSFDISYAKASDLVSFVRSMNMLTPSRGSITSFELTNKLTVNDIPAVITKIEKIVREQDIPTRQVMIESKVVQSSPNYTKELGIRWGGQYKGHKDGGLANGGADVPITGGLTNNSVVDLLTAANGAIGFGYIKDKYNLDVKLTALENEDKLKILSNPKILSLDNKESEIKQGVALPYLKLNDNGVSTTDFKEAVLEMKVKPKITAANTISLNIEVKKDQKSAQTGVNNEPGIDVRQIKTDLLVESGKTVVIGGIYENTKSRNIKKVPFFGDIPLIGRAFKSISEADQLTELLIFITVTVVESPGTLAQGSNEKN